MPRTPAVTVTRHTAAQLEADIAGLFAAHPELLRLRKSDCGRFCCPDILPGGADPSAVTEVPWAALDRLHTAVFLRGWTYPQAVTWYTTRG